ncbi:MAG: polysaccharide biosynthesis protein [Planctomycetales bacterium]|nr:polysaccharide biosynthesis protein [bacterium]UNM08359.1 MAG: polysaccharide biosynthesis protein [Planctomycetales bacterium]
MDASRLAAQILSDRDELFASDFARYRERLVSMLADKRVMVIGAAGSIGRATAQILLECRPAATQLVDLSENNLAELTRSLRNAFPGNPPEFDCWALDFTGAPFMGLLEQSQPDIILNFAAFKHVRSEKDQYTIAEMLRVNALGNRQLLDWVAEGGSASRLFVISTDKAVNPVSCMGASKRLMERVLFSAAADSRFSRTSLTTTRFANVLFSDGSLPQSFLMRMEQGQPLAGPDDIERYFITPREAGMLCLLAACHDGSGEILIPDMREEDLMKFDEIARRLLELRGYGYHNYGTDTAAAFANYEADLAAGRYPCLFSPSSTSGEKGYEEFVEEGEQLISSDSYADISVLRSDPAISYTELCTGLDELTELVTDAEWLRSSSKADIVGRIARLVPSFAHIETGRNLDRSI